jgi:hypothetical protein
VAPPEILEYCKIEDLLERENHYFNILKPEYNISKVAGSPMLGLKLSEYTKAKMSRSKPNCVEIKVLDLETDIITTYHAISEAARNLNIPE